VADAQIGNVLGVAAVGGRVASLGTITAEGVNTVTVTAAQARQLEVGMLVDARVIATGAVVGTLSARTVTAINVATGVVTYSGADGAAALASDGTEALYVAGQSPVTAALPSSNLNGGKSARAGFDLAGTDTIQQMRDRLKEIAATTYTDAYLNTMTYNDMVYAIRLADAAGSIK
jgi:hypothetical protein